MPADTSGRKLVTLVVPVFNESEVISVFYARARAALESLKDFDYELVFIDDGSRDDSFAQLKAFAAGNPRVRVIKFSRNFGLSLIHI